MRLRVASIGFKLETYSSFADFAAKVRRHLNFAADAEADVAVFPEYFAGGLLKLNSNWQQWQPSIQKLLAEEAASKKITLIGGTHPQTTGTQIFNATSVYDQSGLKATQAKLHLTPCEKSPWHFATGDVLKTFRIFSRKNPSHSVIAAVLICYDAEFPELARVAVQAGAELLLVPSWTDDEHGFWRVRHSLAARCVENYIYGVQAPLLGGLDGVPLFEQAVGRAAVLSPCDVSFPRAGIVAESGWNEEGCIVADLDFDLLRSARLNGSVTPLKDLRPQGYESESN